MMFFATGVSLWLFSFIVFAAASLMPFLWYRLHPYQKKRIFTFLNPEHDALGAGYNIIQSKIAIGSGGLWGKGLINGTQSQLDFLPEHQTDFVFTMLAEELGFVCCSMIIIFYGIIIAFGVYTAINARNHYAKLVAIGTVALFFLHVFINISMVMGLVPVVGVPLPLLSYGGTITLTTLVGIGLLINCHIHNNSYIGGEMQELL
jgi:rod shape determining protein RodA